MSSAGLARVGGLWARDLVEVTSDPHCLDTAGRWAVAVPYAGDPVFARFSSWTADRRSGDLGAWTGPGLGAWQTSLDAPSYIAAVEVIRSAIERGDVYQANVCRVMSAPLPDPDRADVGALFELLDAGNPAPYGGFLRLPDQGIGIASASPELFLEVTPGAQGRRVCSGPIKGTGRTAADLTEKDVAENVMIVDLVRNDISRVSVPGSVHVPRLLELQEHPGLVHLVSYVEGTLGAMVGWPDLLNATFPPGSVTGAPKLAALGLIEAVETQPRDIYCGAFGWVDADTGHAELAVAIRTFWTDGDRLRFGTGAGITWGSDALDEWQETELKAARLTEVAAGTWQAEGL